MTPRYTYAELVGAAAGIPHGMPSLFPCEADQWIDYLPGASPDHKRFAWLNTYIAAAITRIGYSAQEHGETMDAERIVANGTGLCDQVAQVFVSVARALDYHARRIGLYEIAEIEHPTLKHSCHSVAEVYYDGAWRLFDPTTGVYFTITDESYLGVLSFGGIRREAQGCRCCSTLQAVYPPNLYAPSEAFPLGQLVDPGVYLRAKMKVDDE